MKSIGKVSARGYRRLQFADGSGRRYKFTFDSPKDPYLTTFRTKYCLERLRDPCGNNYETLKRCLKWAHSRFGHSYKNESKKSDPISILEEAKSGRRFRCVEHSVVLKNCLAALGIKARILWLKARDIGNRMWGATHVVVEAYLPEYGKWVLADPQYGTMPILAGVPLNAVELQAAMSDTPRAVKFPNLTRRQRKDYLSDLRDVLFYFDVRLDTRLNSENARNKKWLMLVPLDAKNPRMHGRKYRIKHRTYIHSVKEFYPIP